MGRPKLLLPWGDRLVIDAVLDAWCCSRVEKALVVCRSSDHELHKACQRWPVDLLKVDQPPRDMKASVQLGIQRIRADYSPCPNDGFMVAPADLPTLSPRIIDRMVDQFAGTETSEILVAAYGDKESHPVLIPWSMTPNVFELAESEGLNALISRHRHQRVAFDHSERPADIDTPERYEALRRDHFAE